MKVAIKSLLIINMYLLCFSMISVQAQQIKEGFYKGHLGNEPIEMIINHSTYSDGEDNTQDVFSGYYYHISDLLPIYGYFNMEESTKQSFIFEIYKDTEIEGKLIGSFNDHSFKGKWTYTQQVLDFELYLSEGKVPVALHHFQKQAFYPGSSKLSAEYEANWILPKDKKLQEAFIAKLTDDKYANFETMAAAEYGIFSNEYITSIKEGTEYQPITEMEESAMYKYEMSNTTYQLVNSTDYFILARTYYLYSGGAHGMHYTEHYNYSHKAKKILGLEDVLLLKHEDRIAALIKRIIKKKYKIPENTALDEAENSIFISDEVNMPHNFTISKTGITFYFGIYEITPYVYGLFEILIPYEHLLPFMNPSFKL